MCKGIGLQYLISKLHYPLSIATHSMMQAPSFYYTWTVPLSFSLQVSTQSSTLSPPPSPFTIPSPFGTLGDRVKATATTS